MSRRLWVIDPSLRSPETEGVAELLRHWPGEHRLLQPALTPGDGPRPGDGYDAAGIVILGSSASVYDPLPWIAPLAEWLRPLVTGAVRRPVLGICFGHQLVAHAAAGTVGYVREDRGKLSGIETSRFDRCRLLPDGRELRVVVSHREEVRLLPAGYRRVARRGPVENDAIEHEQLPVFGVQFHPEARAEFARHVGIDPATIDERVRADSDRLLGSFCRCVEAQTENEPVDHPPARSGRG
ncbi:MAG TPA: gamma-glutamyl-gamma-aminobutyrate hydrolase family protein [Candidatus Polarisedimenticolaceae bacterium]|nr:gamma-glutamyl-gamma-aminobutyrate hydrolase family protein [Candidatus Polarisedimenticolaceae bacterium]